MGLTQHKNAVANIQEIVNLLLLRGQHRPARRGRLPGARPLQRAGRPHDGHLGAPDRSLPRRSRASSASSRRATTASTPSVRSRRCTTGACKVFFALGGNFLSATPDTEYTAEALAPLSPDRARLDQAEPRAPRHGRAGADPAVPRPHRGRRAGRRGRSSSPSKTRWAWSTPRAGSLAPASEHLLSEPAIVARLARATSRRARRRRLGAAGGKTTTASAT